VGSGGASDPGRGLRRYLCGFRELYPGFLSDQDASGLAVTATSVGGGFLRPWHWAGAIVRGGLYLLALFEAYVAFRSRDAG
jgi:hypothetical protein